MAVYVDLDIFHWRGKMWAHLIADTDEELHKLAESIGLKRGWFQNKKITTIPHYDITSSKRKQAIAVGALEIDRDRMGEFIRNYKRTGDIHGAVKSD